MDLTWTGSEWQPFPIGPNGEHHSAMVALSRSTFLPFKIPSLRNLYDKFGLDFQQKTNRAGFGFFHDGGTDSLVRFIQDGFDFRSDQETADMVAFLLAFTGSDLLPGSFNNRDLPPGARSLDTHAAVGRQVTVAGRSMPPLLGALMNIVTSDDSRVDLVAKMRQDGIERGWFFDRSVSRFQSDRQGESALLSEVLAGAAPGHEITFTAVPRGSGWRIGIDRDDDGILDADDPTSAGDVGNALHVQSVDGKPTLLPLISITRSDGVKLGWSVPHNSRFRIQFKDTINDPAWTDLAISITDTENEVRVEDSGSHMQRFYRLVQEP